MKTPKTILTLLPLLLAFAPVWFPSTCPAQGIEQQLYMFDTYSFTASEGLYPNGLIQGRDGALYGTTDQGGIFDVYDLGTVFKLSTNGSGYTGLYTFTGSGGDGESPVDAPIQASDGALYGTTSGGGTHGYGTVFKVNTNGSGYAVLYSFAGGAADGASPFASLLQGRDGALYGTTSVGGTYNQGTVFKLSTTGSGYTLLHHFGAGGVDGETPVAALVQGADGALYGTTEYGGTNSWGTVFKLNTNGTGYTVLYNFASISGDGLGPQAPLVQGTDGTLYGTAETSAQVGGYGALFKLSTNGSGYAVLHFFSGTGGDGANPYAGLVQAADGALYGTTYYGGNGGSGTVFRLSTNGSGYSVLYSFGATSGDGEYPRAALVQGRDGGLYSTTSDGGTDGYGTAYRFVTPPLIMSPPQNFVAATGGSASFTVSASGIPAPAYYWQFNGTNLANNGQFSGVTSSTLAITGTSQANAGNYTVVLSNAYGSVTSAVATLTVQFTANLIDQAYGIGAGSFELGNYNTNAAIATGPSNGTGLAGGWGWGVTGTTITGWVCSTNVNWDWQRWQDADGSKDVELGANELQSGISTTLHLSAGTNYTLSFALSSTPTYNPGVIQVTFGSAVQSFTNPATTSFTNMQWVTNTMSFTPTSTGNYQLQFYHPLYGSIPVIDAVSVIAPANVQFTAIPTTGLEPLSVQFNCPAVDGASNAIVSWKWNFGDGSTSTIQNPSHTYTTASVFHPSLVATNTFNQAVFGSGPSITVTSTPPVISFAPLTNGQVVASLANLAGWVSYNFSANSAVTFSIHELDINGGPGRWWNGTNFQSASNALPATITGTNWTFASNVVLPALNSGLSYQLFATATNISNRASTNLTVVAPTNALQWDPGQTPLGTMVVQNPNTNGGYYIFEITPQTPAVGVWRTALDVSSGTAYLYMSEGAPPTTSPPTYAFSSQMAGSNGWVLDNPNQFTPGNPYYILVSATPGAQWKLVTGDVFVYDLKALATDASSSTNINIGAEGMAFFKTTLATNVLAWQLWLNGATNMIYVKQSSAPDRFSYDLSNNGPMLIVPPYLNGSYNEYFISVPGLPGGPVNLDSRQQPVIPWQYGAFTNLAVGPANFPYVTYAIDVPSNSIAWQLTLTPTNGAPDIAVRYAAVPNEFNNDAYSDVSGGVENSISLVPAPASASAGSPGLRTGRYYATVYGTAPFTYGFTNGAPTVTPSCFLFTVTNNMTNLVGWRYYSVPNIAQQLGTLGWQLVLSNAPPGSEIAVRRNNVPSQWNYRNDPWDNSFDSLSTGYVDQSSYLNVLQQPRHQADIWYIGVYSPTQALGSFVLSGQQIVPEPASFDNPTSAVSITGQPAGLWQFFKISVPSDTNLLGWDIRLTNVTAGTPQMVVSRNELPGDLNTTYPWYPGSIYTYPWSSTSWPDGNQWAGGVDWTLEPNNSSSQPSDISMLAVGTGNPLQQAATYYIGVFDPNGPDSYTLLSRGIGTNYTIPVVSLNWTNGAATNTLAPREAAYYSVIIPSNAPSWRVKVTMTSGDAVLLVQKDYLPNSQAAPSPENYVYSEGSAAYPVYGYDGIYLPSGGIKMQKVGNEHYVLLPEDAQAIPAGTYYLAVVSEGVGSTPGINVGSNATSYVVQSLGPLPVIDLGTIGTSGLSITNPMLEGGDVAAYQFSLAPGLSSSTNRVDMTVALTNVTAGAPDISLTYGTSIPNGYTGYGEDGGSNPDHSATLSLVPITDPTNGVYTVAVQQQATNQYNYPDTGYTLTIQMLVTASTPMPFDGAGSSVSVTNQPAGRWQYFQIVVPSDTNLLGWDLRLTNVTSGYPELVVGRDQLPMGNPEPYTGGQDWPFGPSAAIVWSDGDQWMGGQDWTGDQNDSNGNSAKVNMLEMGMGNPLQPGTYYVGIYDEYQTNADSYTLASRGIGTNYSIPVTPLNWAGGTVTNTLTPREAAYYSVVIPSNTPSWRLRLLPTTGDALLLVQENYLPNVGASPPTGGSAAYPNYNGLLPSGGIQMQKLGTEHYLLLPQQGKSSIPAGTYYLGVVSEGVNSQMGYAIGSNATTYVMQSLGSLTVTNMGTDQITGLAITNSLLEGGDVAAFQFTFPPGLWSSTNRVDMTVALTNVTDGGPYVSLISGTNVPSDATGYGEDGGSSTSLSGTLSVAPLTDPTPGVYTVAVQQPAYGSYNYPDTGFTLTVQMLVTASTPMSFDGAGSSMNVTNQPAGRWQYFQIAVPSDTNLLGWDLRLTNVTGGSPQMVVCSGQLPTNSYSTFTPAISTSWPVNGQWAGGSDWTEDDYDSMGDWANVSMLAMGMGNPLQPGTYYIGIYDQDSGDPASSYTVLSRGIGTGYSIPVVPLNWSNGTATNTLAPREAAYYSVVVPTNTPSWRIEVTAVAGDALLLVQQNYLPNVDASASPYGTAAYPNQQGYLPSGGIRMEKFGNEHYVLLPQSGHAAIPPGTYYLGVVSEGVGSQPDYQIGSNATTYVVQSLGTLPVTDLGLLGAYPLVTTNNLDGGDLAAYQFTLGANTLGAAVFFQGAEGSPSMSLISGTSLPAPNYPPYQNSYISSEGGQITSLDSNSSLLLRNPSPGTFSLVVMANAINDGSVADGAYTLQIAPTVAPGLNISSVLNTNGGTNMASGALGDGTSAFFQVNVPAYVDGAPILGWQLNVSVSSGSALVRARPSDLPDQSCDTTSFASGSLLVAPPFLTPGTWYVEVQASGSTVFTLSSSVITTNNLARAPWSMPVVGQTNTAPGLAMPEFGDTGVDTNGLALPDDQGVSLAQGGRDFYAIIVPTNNAGLLRTELQAISGSPSLYVRVGAAPTFDHLADGCLGASLVDRQLVGNGNTAYGNWVPLDGKTETNLPPGLWILSVYAAGDGNARYRLQLSCGNPVTVTNGSGSGMMSGGGGSGCGCSGNGGSSTNGSGTNVSSSAALVQVLPLDGSITYSNQVLAGGDWRYYQIQIPSNAPNNLIVNWTCAQGSAELFVRDTVPPGDANYSSDYEFYPDAAASWATDLKNQGPYSDGYLPGIETFTTPPLRPGAFYYLGFWSPNDATFSVTCITNGGSIDLTNVISLANGPISATVPAHGSLQYELNVPEDATGIAFDANNSSNVVLSLEQGTLALAGGPAHWVSPGANCSLDQPFTGIWPWLSGYTYYLTVTNESDTQESLNLSSSPSSEPPAITNFRFSGANLLITASSGVTGSTCIVLTTTNLALPFSEWTPIATNTLSASGDFTITATNAINNNSPQRFYILKMQ